VNLGEKCIDLDFNGGLSTASLNFSKFKLLENTLSHTNKKFQAAEDYNENIFRFRIQPECQETSSESVQQSSSLFETSKTELVQLMCSMCKANLLKPVDSLPEKR
jgi:hypothetical protein